MHAPRTLIGITTLATLTMLALTAPPALATVSSVTPATPVKIIVDQQSETFSVPVSTTVAAQGVHAASLWVTYPGAVVPELIGSATDPAQQISLRATVDTTRMLTWGPVQATVMDDADGTSTPVTLDIRRRTRAVLNQVELRSGHRVSLGARVTHYSPAVNRYIPSNLSPVVYQEYVAGSWVRRATSFSKADGLTGVIIRAASGTHYYRVVRMTGLSVWPDISQVRTIVVPRSPSDA